MRDRGTIQTIVPVFYAFNGNLFWQWVYTLLDGCGEEVCTLEEMPVPHGLVPGAHGETVQLRIENGVVVNWPLEPDLEDFMEHGVFI